ncbi:MAG: uracil-DNA glycosylase [Firmicutes bacterium]|nr:uracil-DNA glycosylase [Bacillota bacterium]
MTHPLRPWRDTLEELGVVGLVPPPPVVPPAPEPLRAAESPAWEPPKVARPPAPPARPQPVAPVPFMPPTDPVGCPSPEIVAACASLEELEARIQGCKACPLGNHRLRFVFGEGDPKARLMFIGEGPGQEEDLKGRPFVGRAGELLDKMIAAIGLKRSQVYIANVVKCRPPDNRTPTAQEAQRCLGYLHRQIQLVNPGAIVLLGKTPLQELLGITTGITRIRGQWQRLGEIPVMPTFHPAYVLRQYTQEVRAAVWSDLKAAKAWLDKAEPNSTLPPSTENR